MVIRRAVGCCSRRLTVPDSPAPGRLKSGENGSGGRVKTSRSSVRPAPRANTVCGGVKLVLSTLLASASASSRAYFDVTGGNSRVLIPGRSLFLCTLLFLADRSLSVRPIFTKNRPSGVSKQEKGEAGWVESIRYIPLPPYRQPRPKAEKPKPRGHIHAMPMKMPYMYCTRQHWAIRRLGPSAVSRPGVVLHLRVLPPQDPGISKPGNQPPHHHKHKQKPETPTADTPLRHTHFQNPFRAGGDGGTGHAGLHYAGRGVGSCDCRSAARRLGGLALGVGGVGIG